MLINILSAQSVIYRPGNVAAAYTVIQTSDIVSVITHKMFLNSFFLPLKLLCNFSMWYLLILSLNSRMFMLHLHNC